MYGFGLTYRIFDFNSLMETLPTFMTHWCLKGYAELRQRRKGEKRTGRGEE